MKVYNTDHNAELTTDLKNLLSGFRQKRGFDAKRYADAKAALINAYFKDTPLKTAIVALSGGIDSSVVAGLIDYAKKQEGSPIEHILTPTIPAFVAGATRQEDAMNRAYDVMDFIGSKRLAIDITAPHDVLTKTVEAQLGVTGDEWAKGQSVAHVRTMALAYCATLMQMQDRSGILIGTTNRDEGAYLGYVGKYSDGLVDLQVISDLHKSEVYELAHFLDLPSSTINAIPRGDMYDDRTDTEVFGAPYDFVELYLNFLELSEIEKKDILGQLSKGAMHQFDAMQSNLEKLHSYNGHKYLGNQPGSPAYHLDILRSGVPGGWHNTVVIPSDNVPSQDIKNKMPGFFETSDQDFILQKTNKIINPTEKSSVDIIDLSEKCAYRQQQAILVNDLLSKDEVDQVQKIASEIAPWIPVGEDGMKKNFNVMSGDKIGSWRATTFSKTFSEKIWSRLQPIIPAFEYIETGTSVDALDAQVWKAVGVNSKLSFIMYRPDDKGNLVAHYDAPFDYGDGRRTLKSLILYFNDMAINDGGSTRFIHDPQASTPPSQRNFEDWEGNATKNQIIATVPPTSGSALIFDHRVLHESEPLKGNARPKLIIRSDIVYQRVITP